MKPTIGIIGGCGPLASVDIEYKILNATKRLLAPLLDQDYFNMLVFNNTQFSDRNDAITQNDQELFSQFLHCAKALHSIGANLLLIACQTAHVYLPKLKSVLKLPMIDIVEETVNYILRTFPNISKIGLLATEATQRKGLYQSILASYGIEVICASPDIQKRVMEAIYIIKTGMCLSKKERNLSNTHYSEKNQVKYHNLKEHPYRNILLEKSIPNPIVTIQEAMDYLANKGCQQIILGCTELPLLLPYLEGEEYSAQLIDPNTIVSESAVAFLHRLEKDSAAIQSVFEPEHKFETTGNDEVLKLCVE